MILQSVLRRSICSSPRGPHVYQAIVQLAGEQPVATVELVRQGITYWNTRHGAGLYINSLRGCEDVQIRLIER